MALALVSLQAQARDLVQHDAFSLEFSGSLRERLTFGHGTDVDRFQETAAATLPSPACIEASLFADCPAFEVVNERDVWKTLTRLRTRFDLSAGDRVSGAIAYDHQLEFGILRTFEEALGRSLANENLFDLEDEIHWLGLREDSAHARWSHRIYRGYVRLEERRAELVLGRQRIPWGVGRLWNPIDRFNAIPPLAIEADESPGVDALDLKWRFSDFTFLELAWAPGERSDESSQALRLHGVWRDSDYSVMVGVFDRARTVGVDLAANVGQGVARLEAVYSNPEKDVWPIGEPAPSELDSFWQIVLSFDRRLDWGSGLYVLVEHFYNGNALGFGRGLAGPRLPFFESSERPPDPLAAAVAGASGPFVRPADAALLGGSRVVTLAEHQTGLQLAYEPVPVLALEGLVIVDWNGPSAAFFPTLRYSGFSAAELLLGVQLFAGPRRSAFGDQDPLAFVLIDLFF
jgi:hypothetical protein